MELIPITPEYYEFVRLLRMDPRVTGGFIREADITPEEQEVYMEKYSNNYHVCLSYNEPVGYIGVINNDIRVCTHPDHSKKGVGKYMLKQIMELYPRATGKIKTNNTSSIRLFEACRVPYELI